MKITFAKTRNNAWTIFSDDKTHGSVGFILARNGGYFPGDASVGEFMQDAIRPSLSMAKARAREWYAKREWCDAGCGFLTQERQQRCLTCQVDIRNGNRKAILRHLDYQDTLSN